MKIKLAGAAFLILTVLALVTPSNLRQRYFTLFGSNEPEHQIQMTVEERKEYAAATGSAEARLRLLKDSLIITFRHPLFGVGPGNFMVEQNNLAIARGELGLWHVTHNTYTQVSSEMGIPGLIFYLAFLYQIFKVLNSIIRSQQSGATRQDLRALAMSLRYALVALVTVAFFDSFAYNPDLPILAGLAAALGYIAQEEQAASRVPSARKSTSAAFPEPVLESAWTKRF